MAFVTPSGLRGLPKVAKDMQNQPIKKRGMPPIEPPAWLVERAEAQGVDPRLEWEAMNPQDPVKPAEPDMLAMMPSTEAGIFASDGKDAKGALGGMTAGGMSPSAKLATKPVEVGRSKEGPGWLDYIGLAGATLQEMGGVGGAVNDFMGNRRTMGQEGEMNALLEGLDLTPEELGLVKAGMGRDVLAQRVDDKRENTRYTRGRKDTIADQTRMRGWDEKDRDIQIKTTDKRDIRGMAADQARHDDTMRFNWAKLKADADADAAKIAATAAQGAQLDGPQLTSIYNNAMTFVDEQAAALKSLDQVMAASQAFVDLAYGKGANGTLYNSGVGMGESFNQLTDGRSPRLEAFTSSITPLMRAAGSGSMSDGDAKMFREGVVNIRNRREGNEYAAKSATAVRNRQADYVAFLRENIDINDPTSRQYAQALWSEYANAVPLFNPQTGQPNEQAPAFDDWAAAMMQAKDGTDPLAPPRVTTEEEINALPPGSSFIGPDGVTRRK